MGAWIPPDRSARIPPLAVLPETLFGYNYKSTNTVIIGHNETLPVILRELPENVSQVYLAAQNTTKEEQAKLERIAAERELRLDYYQGDLHEEENMIEFGIHT